jgi:hypothetical protein
MTTQLYPSETHDEIVRKLLLHHQSNAHRRGNVLHLDCVTDEHQETFTSITTSTVQKSSFITDLFGELLERVPSFGKVSTIAGYPFDIVVARPPYTIWFPEDYPVPETLPVEVLFIYLAFQLLQTDGLLVMTSDSDRRHWPEDQIHKIGKLIEVHPLPSASGQPAVNNILVYRKKPTDAVRYGE